MDELLFAANIDFIMSTRSDTCAYYVLYKSNGNALYMLFIYLWFAPTVYVDDVFMMGSNLELMEKFHTPA